MQVTIGIRSGIQVGTLHYYTTTSTPDLLPLYVSTAVTLACIIICLTITTITCVYRYRKKKAKAEGEASDLRNLVDREREANEELEQQVENMESQVFMVHSQMKGECGIYAYNSLPFSESDSLYKYIY